MYKAINNGEYTIYECTAIAFDAGDTEPQPALFCRGSDDDSHDGDCVIFGYALDELEELNAYTDGISSDEDVLKSVRIDGQPLTAFCL